MRAVLRLCLPAIAVLFGLTTGADFSAPLTGIEPAAHAATVSRGIIPAPVTTTSAGAPTAVTSSSRIIYPPDAGLAGYAKALQGDISAVTGLKLATLAGGTPALGDVSVALAGTSRDGSYTLRVNGRAELEAGDTNGLANAAASLLQMLQAGTKLPPTTIVDVPDTRYRAVMVDVARGYWSVSDLENIVDLSHLYKINYLHLHLTDDQNFMFPSEAFPDLSSRNESGHPAYTVSELKTLDQYAADRGVTIIPELDVPGHSKKMVEIYPQVFGGSANSVTSTINISSPKARSAVKAIIGEMIRVFVHTPYFHFGADESSGSGGQFASFINELDDYINAQGKASIVWEGFTRDIQSKINRDIVIESWINQYYRFDDAIADGFTVINAGWTPLYRTSPVWEGYEPSQVQTYTLDKYTSNATITVPPSTSVAGASLASWGYNGATGLKTIRQGLPAMAARLWNPDLEAGLRTFSDFTARFATTDAAASKLLTISPDWEVHKVNRDGHLEPQTGGEKATRIAVDPTGRVFTVNAIGQMHKWDGSQWNDVPGPAASRTFSDVAAGAGGIVAAIVDDRTIWRRDDKGWSSTHSRPAKSVAISGNGDIWSTDTAGKVWQYTDGSWIDRSNGQNAATVAAGGGTVAITTNSGHDVFIRSNGSWKDTGGEGTALSIDASGSIWALSERGQVWRNEGSWKLRMDGRGSGGFHAFAVGSPEEMYVLSN